MTNKLGSWPTRIPEYQRVDGSSPYKNKFESLNAQGAARAAMPTPSLEWVCRGNENTQESDGNW